MSLNGVKLRPNEYVKDQTKSTLNMMLGDNGLPKYSLEQLKDIKRQDLLDEVLKALEAQQLPTKPVSDKNGKRGAKPKPSKNANSARAKKCNWIRDLANGKLTLDNIKEMYDNDYELQKVCKWSELETAAKTGKRPKNRSYVTIKDSDYIVAYGLGEGSNNG